MFAELNYELTLHSSEGNVALLALNMLHVPDSAVPVTAAAAASQPAKVISVSVWVSYIQDLLWEGES